MASAASAVNAVGGSAATDPETGVESRAVDIAYLADAPIPSRSANAVQVLHMCAALVGLGHGVRLVSPWQAGRPRTPAQLDELHARFALPRRVPLVYLPYVELRGRLRASYHYAAAAYARLAGARLVYTRNPRIAALAARLGLRTVFEAHTPPNSRAGWAAVRALAVHPRALFVFISDSLRARFAHEIALPEARTRIEHDAVDSERFATPIERAAARAQLGQEPGGRWVVHVGHLYEGRGAELLLDLLPGLPDDVRLVFVGGHEGDVARIRAEADRRALGSRVLLTGHRPVAELPRWLWAADVLVLPYTTRTVTSDGATRHAEYASPMKLFEYLAAGRPIVAARFPSIAEVLRDGEGGLLAAPDDAAAWRAALGRVLSDRDLADRLGARARQLSGAYTWPARAQRIVAAAAALTGAGASS